MWAQSKKKKNTRRRRNADGTLRWRKRDEGWLERCLVTDYCVDNGCKQDYGWGLQEALTTRACGTVFEHFSFPQSLQEQMGTWLIPRTAQCGLVVFCDQSTVGLCTTMLCPKLKGGRALRLFDRVDHVNAVLESKKKKKSRAACLNGRVRFRGGIGAGERRYWVIG